jgi:hypothetical protein
MATNVQHTTARPRTAPATVAGVALIALTGLIHAVEAPDYLKEKAYVGALFIAAAVGSALVVAWLWTRSDPRAWGLGALIAVGCFAGFVLSRTTGLPGGFKEEEWEPLGIVSLIVEAGFVGVALSRLRR